MMSTDLPVLYAKYVAYVKRLQEDFVLHVGADVAPAYRPQILGLTEFLQVWDAWGNASGAQEMWRQRFESGYDVAAKATTERLRAALCPAACGAARKAA